MSLPKGTLLKRACCLWGILLQPSLLSQSIAGLGCLTMCYNVTQSVYSKSCRLQHAMVACPGELVNIYNVA